MERLRSWLGCRLGIGCGPQSGCCQSMIHMVLGHSLAKSTLLNRVATTTPTTLEETISFRVLYTGALTRRTMRGGVPTTSAKLFTPPMLPASTLTGLNGVKSTFSPISIPVCSRSCISTSMVTSMHVANSPFPIRTVALWLTTGARLETRLLHSTRTFISFSMLPLAALMGGSQMGKTRSHGSMHRPRLAKTSGRLEINGTPLGPTMGK